MGNGNKKGWRPGTGAHNGLQGGKEQEHHNVQSVPLDVQTLIGKESIH